MSSKGQTTEALLTTSPYNRSNLWGEDPRPETQSRLNNLGAGITPTLTINTFYRSFPDWTREMQQFASLWSAPVTVVGQGFKNIQWGIKGTEKFVEVKVGDVVAVKVKDRGKVYESIVPSDNQIRWQCSLDYPPHFHVNKFISVGDWEQFMDGYKSVLGQSMSKTLYDLLRFFFISSAYGACLPQREYDKLLLKTLMQTDPLPLASAAARPFENEPPIYSPLMMQIINHRDHFKMMSDEMNRKISNINVYDVQDVIYTSKGVRFDPYRPWKFKGETEMDAMKRVANCLKPREEGLVELPPTYGLPDGNLIDRKWRMSREKSLKAFEIVLATIGDEVERPNTHWWQGNCGNVYGSHEKNWQSTEAPAVRYPSNRGTKIMDKPMSERPMLEVVCHKENKVLIMSRSDFNDFTSGVYDGWFGSESMGKINFGGNVASKYSEIIPIDGLVGGHAIIMDRRMVVLVPHLESAGTDTIAQRLLTVSTMHKWIIFGLFDQFVGARIQMTGFTANPLEANRFFFSDRDTEIYTSSHGRDAIQ